MEVSEWVARLSDLTADEFRTVAEALRESVDTAEGEVAWWRATACVSASLRRQRRSREACRCAHDTTSAVLAAAERAGVLESEHDTVIVVARAAAEVTRGLLAGPGVAPELEPLVLPWRRGALAA